MIRIVRWFVAALVAVMCCAVLTGAEQFYPPTRFTYTQSTSVTGSAADISLPYTPSQIVLIAPTTNTANVCVGDSLKATATTSLLCLAPGSISPPLPYTKATLSAIAVSGTQALGVIVLYVP